MMTKSQYPPPTFQFALTLDSHPAGTDASFSEASGIQAEMQIEEAAEGGANRFVHRLAAGVRHPTLVLKRGVAPAASPLVGWCRDVLGGLPSIPIVKQALRVSLLDEEGRPLRTWRFVDAWPCKWEIDASAADKSAFAIEQVEFQYASMVRDDEKA
jgi:phage tail-like protein